MEIILNSKTSLLASSTTYLIFEDNTPRHELPFTIKPQIESLLKDTGKSSFISEEGLFHFQSVFFFVYFTKLLLHSLLNFKQ